MYILVVETKVSRRPTSADELIEYYTIYNDIDQLAAGVLEILPFAYPGFPLGDIAFQNKLVSDRRDYGHID